MRRLTSVVLRRKQLPIVSLPVEWPSIVFKDRLELRGQAEEDKEEHGEEHGEEDGRQHGAEHRELDEEEHKEEDVCVWTIGVETKGWDGQ